MDMEHKDLVVLRFIQDLWLVIYGLLFPSVVLWKIKRVPVCWVGH